MKRVQPQPPDPELVETSAGMACPFDMALVILRALQKVECPKCGRTWFAVGHLDFDFDWAGGWVSE